MTHIVAVKPRTRAGTYATFDGRYRPQSCATDRHDLLWHHDQLPKDIDPRRVWTIVDCDGKLYVVPGYATVNYFSRMVTEYGWSDTEQANPGYVY